VEAVVASGGRGPSQAVDRRRRAIPGSARTTPAVERAASR
jgi:hypothetical protein